MTSTDLRQLPHPEEVRVGTVPALFAQVAAAMPEAVAVRGAQGRSWTFAELDRAAANFAHTLRSVVTDDGGDAPRIGLHLPHGVPMIAAQLGALAAGCCYVPLDPTYPATRLRLMTEIAGVAAVVTTASDPTDWGVPRLEMGDLVTAVPLGGAGALAAIDPERAAYILFTSGSTGRPKGVLHTHRSMLHGIANHLANMTITSRDQVSVLTSFSFDMAVSDLYSALLAGATAVPLDVRTIGVPALARGLHDARVTVFHSTPTVFRLLVAQGEPMPTVRLAVLGGEPVHRDDVPAARRMFAPDCVLVNGYGFTEASFVVQQQIRHDDPVDTAAMLPIGRPLPGYDVRVESVDSDGVGDLVIESDVLTRGYVGDAEQTRARFSADGRIYRPGDRVRLLPDGRFAFAGRADGQVKVHGVRVELAEIQLALERQPDVARAVVHASDAADGVIAHVQAAPGVMPTEADLRARLRDELPDVMVPTRCQITDALPLTPSGKVDIRALTAPVEVGMSTLAENSREQLVLDAWIAAVGADPGGLDIPFFDAGGGSLALARLHQGLRGRTSESPSPAALLGAGTVRGMARLLAPQARPAGDAVRARAVARSARRRARAEQRG